MPYERVWSYRASLTRKALDLLLELHDDAEIVAFDAGKGEAILARDGDSSVLRQIAPAVPSPWALIRLRWWPSICSSHRTAQSDCERCQTFTEVDTEYAIWKQTGDVYRVQDDGTLGEDPYMSVPR